MQQDSTRRAADARVRFREYLARKGLNFSQPRAIILSQIAQFDRHFGAEELVQALRGGQDRVARGTVYRTLSLLEQAGMIRKIHNQGGHRYELSLGEDRHDHLFCEQCGQTFEFRDERLPVAIRQASQELQFQPRTYTVEVLGVCGQCAEAAAE